MDKKKLSKRILGLIVFMFFVHFIASNLYWYTSIWWLDMPMHFLGGIFVGLLLFRIFVITDINNRNILKIILGVLLIGIIWELFELIFVNYIAGNLVIPLDTMSDIFFDLAGGTIAVIYFSKRIMIDSKNTL